jgi:short subunit dehydrogenase-like uncharacterized protein
MAREAREFEIVVWGASGFTGKLTAEYLAGRLGPGELRWALAGRNREKLEAVRDAIGADSGLPILIGDSDDSDFLADLAGRTAVVCTTVGPYAKYGSPLVAACAAAGTDYCDLTGEVHWVQRMIEAHQDAAAENGARIVFSCGFDCIPSDLGAFFMQREMQARHGVPCSKVQYRVKGFSGGASGGTVASMLTMMEEAERDPSVRRVMTEPYALNPKDQQSGPDAAERATPSWDADFGQWTSPFVMAGVNTKVVRRSNALLDFSYGKGFRYDEAVLNGAGPAGFAKAAGTSAGTAAMMAGMAIGPLRRMVSGRLPQPGDGPSKEKRESGYFEIELRGEHPSDADKVLRARVRGDRDPGYGSTSKMLAESALCLARDELAVPGGCWTTASAMGDALLTRLNQHAGVTFELED